VTTILHASQSKEGGSSTRSSSSAKLIFDQEGKAEEACNTCKSGESTGSDASVMVDANAFLKIASTSFISRDGVVTAGDLEDINLLQIVEERATDTDVNILLWKCLGYEYNEASGVWKNDKVFPKWALKFPEPPDLIGVTRRYDPDTDRRVRNASMDLMRSIPRDFKGGVRSLAAVGFKGYKLNELTPNKTRRAQATNWLIYYREKLFGKSVEELRRQRQEESAVAPEIEALPSEKYFQKLRLDSNN